MLTLLSLTTRYELTVTAPVMPVGTRYRRYQVYTPRNGARYALMVTAPGMPVGTRYHRYRVYTPRNGAREHL
jgi:hypothetical protein